MKITKGRFIIKIDGETENLDREPAEALLTPEGFEKIIYEDL